MMLFMIVFAGICIWVVVGSGGTDKKEQTINKSNDTEGGDMNSSPMISNNCLNPYSRPYPRAYSRPYPRAYPYQYHNNDYGSFGPLPESAETVLARQNPDLFLKALTTKTNADLFTNAVHDATLIAQTALQNNRAFNEITVDITKPGFFFNKTLFKATVRIH